MVPAEVPTSLPPQGRASLGHIREQLLQQPPQDAVVGETVDPLSEAPAPAMPHPLRPNVLVDILQGGVQCLIHGGFGARAGASTAMPVAAASGRGALFPAERHRADQESQLGEARVWVREQGCVGVGRGGDWGAGGRTRLQACSLALVLAHGGETRVGGRAAALAGADEVAVLEALALTHALVTLVVAVVVVVVAVEELVPSGGGRDEALRGCERAVVEVALAAEGRGLQLDEVTQVRGSRVDLAVRVLPLLVWRGAGRPRPVQWVMVVVLMGVTGVGVGARVKRMSVLARESVWGAGTWLPLGGAPGSSLGWQRGGGRGRHGGRDGGRDGGWRRAGGSILLQQRLDGEAALGAAAAAGAGGGPRRGGPRRCVVPQVGHGLGLLDHLLVRGDARGHHVAGHLPAPGRPPPAQPQAAQLLVLLQLQDAGAHRADHVGRQQLGPVDPVHLLVELQKPWRVVSSPPALVVAVRLPR